MTAGELGKMPKIELHCHLDGSLGRAFLEKRLGRKVSPQELSVPDDCASLAEYLEKFALPCSCLMDEEGLEGAGHDILKTMSAEQVCYAEIRFAPLLSVTAQMGTQQGLAALLRGLERARRESGTEYNVIVCAMRHHTQEQNYEMIKAASRFLGSGVCAADLAGDEARYPMSGFMELFAKVRRLGMPFTIHAGECGNAANIEDALRAGAARIGHGIAMRGNPALQEKLARARTGVEMCPVSNLQTKAVESTAHYPLREFLDAGIAVSINTDNRTVSRTSLTGELVFIQKTYAVSDDEILQLTRNAIQTSFADADVKKRLQQKLAEFEKQPAAV